MTGGGQFRAVRQHSIFDFAEFLYDALGRRRQSRLADVVADHLKDLPRAARVLDLGAGSGWMAARVEGTTPTRVIACDVDLQPIRQAGVLPSGGVVAADGQALPFASACFAAIYLVYVFHHVADQTRLLTEVGRVLRDDGRLILVEFDAASGLVSMFRLLARLTGRRCWFHSPRSLSALLRRSGFIVNLQRLDRATFAIVAGRNRPRGGAAVWRPGVLTAGGDRRTDGSTSSMPQVRGMSFGREGARFDGRDPSPT